MTTIHSHSAHSSIHAPRSVQTLTVGYTPDSDDAFNFYAWEHGHVELRGWSPQFQRRHISVLNHAAAADLLEVVNISAVMYPALADRYWILATGSSVGRGYGPMLVSRHFESIGDLANKRIAVAELSTTGGMLAQMFCPKSSFVAMSYHRIADAILAGDVDAGVMIHEELIHYPKKGLRLVSNLGLAWNELTSLPLPVGLNVVSRRLGIATSRDIQNTCHASLRWALDNQQVVLEAVSDLGRGEADTFVPMFSNSDTLFMPPDVREGLAELFARTHALGLTAPPPRLEIIDG